MPVVPANLGSRSPRAARLLGVGAAVALSLGVAAGLSRLGWSSGAAWAAGLHGPLMVCGFFGTAIGLERAVAVGRPLAWSIPALCVLATLSLLALPSPATGAALLSAAGAGLTLIFARLVREHREGFLAVMGVGAATWAVGSALWLAGQPLVAVVPWWAGFLVLTIVGERMELSRLTGASRSARVMLVGGLTLYLGGLVLGLLYPDLGARGAFAGLGLLAAWGLRRDVARRTIRARGLPRYIAACLLAGYAWLAAAAVIGIYAGAPAFGPLYDALWHAIFVGFVLSMVFGHAPIILPAVARVRVPYRRIFWLHLALLHGSLALRIGADLLAWSEGRRWGALINAAALLLFVLNTAGAALWARRRPTPRDEPASRHP